MFKFESPIYIITKFQTKNGEYTNRCATVMIGSERKVRTVPVDEKVYEQLKEKTQYETVTLAYVDGISKKDKPYHFIKISD